MYTGFEKNMQTFCLPGGLWTLLGQPYNAEGIQDFKPMNDKTRKAVVVANFGT